MALMPQRGMPVPPMPVMPPEGVAPVTDPASTGTAPDASPTTMVLQYLKSRGFTPSSENVRRALEANQRDPGVIPGLVSDRPATDAEDRAAMAAAGKGGGQGGGGVGSGGLVREEGPWDVGDKSSAPAQNTSAPPTGGGGPSTDALGWMVAAGLPLAGAVGYGTYRNRAPGPGTPMPGASVPPPPDVAAGIPGVPPAGPEVPPLATPAPTSPMEAALAKATAPPGPEVPPTLGGVQPVPGMANMPPQGPVEAVAPQVPFNSQSPRVPPTAADVAALPRTSPTLRGTPLPRDLRIPRPPLLRVP